MDTSRRRTPPGARLAEPHQALRTTHRGDKKIRKGPFIVKRREQKNLVCRLEPPHPELNPVPRQLPPPFDLGHVGRRRPAIEPEPALSPRLFPWQREGLPYIAVVGRPRLSTSGHAASRVFRGAVGDHSSQLVMASK